MTELLEVWWRASLIRCFSVTTGILPWPLLDHVRVNRADFFWVYLKCPLSGERTELLRKGVYFFT